MAAQQRAPMASATAGSRRPPPGGMALLHPHRRRSCCGGAHEGCAARVCAVGCGAHGASVQTG